MAILKEGDVVLLAQTDDDVMRSISDGAYRMALVTEVKDNKIIIKDYAGLHNISDFGKRTILSDRVLFALYEDEISMLNSNIDKINNKLSRLYNFETSATIGCKYSGDLSLEEMIIKLETFLMSYSSRLSRIEAQLYTLKKHVSELKELQ